ncbi:MAG: hypothetical protein ABL903_16740 [Methylococcales bacterium]
MTAINIFSDENIVRIYGTLRSELNNLSVSNIRNTAAAAGFDVTKIPAQSEARYGLGSRAEVMSVIDRLFSEMTSEVKVTTLQILAQKLIIETPRLEESVRNLLGQHGFQFIDNAFVPIGILDAREALYLPPSSASELARAMKRLIEGDESGAITAACGAVDLVTQSIYNHHSLGNPEKVSFAAKVGTILKDLDISNEMETEFQLIGISRKDAISIAENISKATNNAAEALQTLRRSMGDVHGTKPTLRKSAYDAIKWASAICGLLEGKAS